MMKTRTGSLAAALTLTALLVAGGASRAVALDDFRFTESRSFEVGAEPEIDLESLAGDVSYTATKGTRATVDIVIVVRAKHEDEAEEIRDELTIKVDGRDGFLEASVERPKKFWKWLKRQFGRSRSVSVSFHVTGPHGARGFLSSVSGNAKVEGVAGPIDVSTVSGDAIVRDVSRRLTASSVSGECKISDCGGAVRAETVSGNLRLEGCGDDLRAESVSGSIEVSGVSGDAEVSTVSGDVDLQSIYGEVAVTTTSGDIRVEHHTGGLELQTVSGDISARTASSNGEMVVHSTSGSVEFYADPGQMGKVDLSTFSGEIRLDTDVHVRKYSKRGLKGRVGNGDVHVKITTHSGDIRLGEL